MAKIELTIEQLEQALNVKRAEQLQPLKDSVKDLWSKLQSAVKEVRKSEPKYPAPWQAWLAKERAETAIKRLLSETPNQTEAQIVAALAGRHEAGKIKKSLTTRTAGERAWFVYDPTGKTYALKP